MPFPSVAVEGLLELLGCLGVLPRRQQHVRQSEPRVALRHQGVRPLCEPDCLTRASLLGELDLVSPRKDRRPHLPATRSA